MQNDDLVFDMKDGEAILIRWSDRAIVWSAPITMVPIHIQIAEWLEQTGLKVDVYTANDWGDQNLFVSGRGS